MQYVQGVMVANYLLAYLDDDGRFRLSGVPLPWPIPRPNLVESRGSLMLGVHSPP